MSTNRPDRPKNPLEALAALRDALPPGPAPAAAGAPAAKAPVGPARAVVRLERKGRGGKEVTVVEKLELPPAELAVWAKALKQSLGVGGVAEDGAIVLQGDVRPRVKALLEQRGVRKVTVG